MVKKILLGFLILFIVTIVGSYFLVFHTSLPFKLTAKPLLQTLGYSVEGLGGSLSSGLVIGKLAKVDDDMEFELTNFRFLYSALPLFLEKKIVVNKINVDGLRVKIIKWSALSGKSKRKDPKNPNNTAKSSKSPQELLDSLPTGLLIKEVSINNVTVEVPGGKKFQFKTLELDNFDVKNKILSLVRLHLESPGLTTTLANIEIDIPKKTGKGEVHLNVKKDFMDVVKNDINLYAKAQVSSKGINNLTLQGLSNTLYVKLTPTEQDVRFLRANFFSYIKIGPKLPITNFEFFQKGPPPKIGFVDFSKGSGKFAWRSAQVHLRKGIALFHDGQQWHKFRFDPKTAAMSMGMVPMFVATVESDEDPKDILSKIIYRRPFEKLSIPKQIEIAKDVRYFSFKQGVPGNSSMSFRSKASVNKSIKFNF